MEDKTIKALLDEEIQTEFETLKSKSLGSEEHKVAVDVLVKLIDKSTELTKVENDCAEKEKNRKHELAKYELDQKLKYEQLKDTKINTVFTITIGVAGLVVPSIIKIWGTKTSLRFEETGTVTTSAGRSFLNDLFRGK